MNHLRYWLFVTLVIAAWQTALSQNPYIVSTLPENTDSISAQNATSETQSPEERFLNQHFPYRSLCDWNVGMKFMVIPGATDAYIRTFTDSITGHEIATASLKHKILIYRGFEPTDRGWFRLLFYCPDNGKTYYDEIRNFSFEEYCAHVQGGGVPALACLDDVDKAREVLVGKELWLQKPTVYQDSEASTEGFVERQLRTNSRVHVEKIGVGTREYPVKIIFSTDNGELFFQNVALSRTNSAMSDEDFIQGKAHHYFPYAFSFVSANDTKTAKKSEQRKEKGVEEFVPVVGHPKVSTYKESVPAADKFMSMMGGMVNTGMTMEEVRMSKGEPSKKHRLNNGGTQWDYYDGTKIQFGRNGLVTKIIQ